MCTSGSNGMQVFEFVVKSFRTHTDEFSGRITGRLRKQDHQTCGSDDQERIGDQTQMQPGQTKLEG